MADTKLYYIQNKRAGGTCIMWWCVDGHGYTSNLDNAWKVSKDQAEQICRSRPKQDIPWPAKKIDKIAWRCVNFESLEFKDRRKATRV